MLNRALSGKGGLKRYALQGIKDLVPMHRRSLGRNALCLLFRRLTRYSNKELQAKHIIEAGNIVRSAD